MARRTPIDLHDALVVVTGAGSGIGQATARAFAAAGSQVVVVDLDGDSARATADSLPRPGGAASVHQVDVADRSAMLTLAERIQADHGVPHVVVNNAGVGMTGRFLDTSAADWTWIIGVNLYGVIHGCQAFGPAMVDAGRGQVVNLSSGLGYLAHATEPAYCTTKAAVLHLSACLRADWAPWGVGVTAICPGVINTPIIDHTRFLGDRAEPANRQRTVRTFRRGHPPTAVADAIVAATRTNRPVVPVGAESWAGWFGHRVLPARIGDRLARVDV